MIQYVILSLAILSAIAGISTIAKGNISLTKSSRVEGASARGIGICLLIVAVLMAGFAWFVLPRL